MEFLHELIQSLTPAEVKGVRTELKNDLISLEMFEILLQETIFSYDQIVKRIYPKGNGEKKKINGLVNKLQKRILDQLIWRESFISDGDKIKKTTIQIKRNLLYLSYLINFKERNLLFLELLKETETLCRNFERYHSLVEVLILKRNYSGLRFGLQEFNILKEEISQYQYYHKATDRALELYQEFAIRRDFSAATDEKERQKLLQKAIEELEKYGETVSSDLLKYYTLYLKIDQAGYNSDYESAICIGKQKLELILNSKVLYEEKRLGATYDDIAAAYIRLRQYDSSINYLYEAQRHFPPDSYNYTVSKRLEFLAHFYLDNIAKAKELINYLILHASRNNTLFRKTEYFLYLAFLLFTLKDFKQALKVLSQPLELTSDKTGWDITVRVLTIMTLTELGHLDEATQHIDRLRKHVERYSKKDFVTERNITITNLLRTLARHEFNFKHPSLDRYLRQLRSPEQAWKPLTPELIPVEVWVKK